MLSGSRTAIRIWRGDVFPRLTLWIEEDVVCGELCESVIKTLIGRYMSTDTFLHMQSFWIDNQTGPKPLEEFVLVESSTTPLYDRKFSLGSNSAGGPISLQG